MGRPGVAGKKRTRRGGRNPGDPPLSRQRCLCPWSKQRGNPPFSSARRAHSYSNHSAAGPRAATFPGRREPPSVCGPPAPAPSSCTFICTGEGSLGKRLPQLGRRGASHQLRCGPWGTERVAEGGAGGHGKREGPGRRQTDIQGYEKWQGGGVGVPETQEDVVLGRDKETGSQRRSGDRDSKARRPGETRWARDKGYKSCGGGEPVPHPSLPSVLLVSQTGDGNLRLQFLLPDPLLPRMSADLRGRNSRHTPSALLQGPCSKSNSGRKWDVSQGERKKRSWAHSWPHRRLLGLRHLLHPPPWLHRAGLGRGRAGEGGRSKPILISPIMSAGLRLEKASGTLNKKNVANAIIEGGSRRAGIASL